MQFEAAATGNMFLNYHLPNFNALFSEVCQEPNQFCSLSVFLAIAVHLIHILFFVIISISCSRALRYESELNLAPGGQERRPVGGLQWGFSELLGK